MLMIMMMMKTIKILGASVPFIFFFDNTHIYCKSNHIKAIRPIKTLVVQTFVQVLNPKRRDINHRGDVICTNSESKSI